MSLRALNWAWEQPLPSSLRVMLLALADHHNGETGQCNPSVERLARLVRISERHVMTQLATLEDLGLITQHRVQHGFRRSANQKELHLGTLIPESGSPPDPHITQTGSRTGIAEPEREGINPFPAAGGVDK